MFASPRRLDCVSASEVLKKSGIALFLGSVLLGTARRSEAASTFTVTSNLDDGSPGTLRSLVALANPGDIINFQPGLASPIVLTSGQIGIDKAITISGPGASLLTVSGNYNDRIFFANDGLAAAAPITISGLTLSQGHPTSGHGGAILSAENLTLTDCVVSNCYIDSLYRGGGIYANALGSVTISGCTFSNNYGSYGGAVFTFANATITNSTFDQNSVDIRGGAVYAGSGISATISGSTFSNNYAVNEGAGIYSNADLTLTQCTISGNNSSTNGAGIFIEGGINVIRNCTIASNTAKGICGGVSFYLATLDIQSTIISGNTDKSGPSDVLSKMVGTLNVTNSLIQTNPGSAINGTNTANIFGQDPLLGPLQNNGGQTRTRALPAGSPALDVGSNPASLATDQRGAPRTSGSGTDIGAFERNVTAPTAALTGAPAVSSSSNPTQYDFTVTFSDDVGVNASTIDNADILITGPNGFSQMAQLVSVTPAGNGTPRLATYRITPPGGTWDAADAGTYTIALLASQVSDVDGNFAAASTLGTFAVNFSATPTPPGTVTPGVDSDSDGFDDELEVALGTNPFSNASTPFTNNAPAGPGQHFTLGGALSIKLDFSGKDKIRARGSVPVRAGTYVPGSVIVFDIGGVIRRFQVNSKGVGVLGKKETLSTVRLRNVSAFGTQNVSFDLSIKGTDLETKLSDEGLTSAAADGKLVNVVVQILYFDTLYREEIPLRYTVKNSVGTTTAK